MGWGRLELGDRGAATGAWQAYLQVLTPSGPSDDTGRHRCRWMLGRSSKVGQSWRRGRRKWRRRREEDAAHEREIQRRRAAREEQRRELEEEAARQREEDARHNQMDADGFVVVTRKRTGRSTRLALVPAYS